MPTMQTLGDQGPQVNPGGAMQVLVPASVHNLPSTISAGNHVTSNLILSDGMEIGAVGVTSTQGGMITVQRYLDDAGTIKQGAALAQAIRRQLCCDPGDYGRQSFLRSFTVDISNTGLSTATLSNLGILLQGK